MKLFKILTLTILTSCSLTSYSQAYWEIYPVTTTDVQNKMNTNKMEGINILSNINANHIIGITGVNINSKTELENLITGNSLVVNVSVSADVTSMILDCNANLTLDEIKAIINQVNGIVTGDTVTYTITE